MSTIKNYGLIAAPKNYESPQDRAVREYMEKEKALAEKRKQMIADLKSMESKKWRAALTDEEIEKIKPGFIQYGKQRDHHFTLAPLIEYFDKNLWPDIYKKFLSKNKE